MQTLLLALSILLAVALTSCKTSSGGSDLSSDGSVPYGSYRFDEVTWLVSHNAFNNKKETTWVAPNQTKDIISQLNDGVRGLMVDLHSYDNKVWLCHNMCDQPGWKTLGGLNRQDPGHVFNPVVEFLRNHREAVITVFLEDYISNAELKKLLDGTNGLRELQFDPYAEDVRGKGWPKIADMVNRNKRLLIISDHGDKQNLGVGFGPDFTAENYWSVGLVKSDYTCKTRWDNIPLNQRDNGFERLFVMNHFRDVPMSIASKEIDNTFKNLNDRAEDYCLPKSGRKPNFVAVDFYEKGDARSFVDRMNQIRAIIYKDADYTGDAQFLYPDQKLNYREIKVGDDAITSIRVYPNAKIVLFADQDWKNFLMDVTSNIRNLGDANDKVTSLRVEKQ